MKESHKGLYNELAGNVNNARLKELSIEIISRYKRKDHRFLSGLAHRQGPCRVRPSGHREAFRRWLLGGLKSPRSRAVGADRVQFFIVNVMVIFVACGDRRRRKLAHVRQSRSPANAGAPKCAIPRTSTAFPRLASA